MILDRESGMVSSGLRPGVDPLLDIAELEPTRSPASSPGSERRMVPRYRTKKGAFAFIRSPSATIRRIDRLSMGTLAFAVFRTHPDKMGEVQDISSAGMAFCYVKSDSSLKGARVLDLLMAESGFYLQGLRYRTVSDIRMADEPDAHSIQTRRISVQFKNITPQQSEKLRYFLKNFTRGVA